MLESESEIATVPALRRAVLWVGIIALLFAAGCALGVLFGALYYKYASVQPDTRLQAKLIRVTMIGIVEKAVIAVTFGILSRALFRYASALKLAPENTNTLIAMQVSCWQAAIWLALLYAGWELTSAIVTALP